MSPIGYAVSFVHDQERDAAADLRQHLGIEPLVGKALRCDEDDVWFVPMYGGLYLAPARGIVGIDRFGAYPHPLRGRNLVTHECEQWADQQCRPHSGLA